LFQQSGSITRKKSSGRSTKPTPEVVDAVEEIIKNEPQISLFHFFSQ
jgi:hypothetical protein